MKKLFLLSGLLSFILITSCGTSNPLSETHKTYPNQIIDSSLKEDPNFTEVINPYKNQLGSIMKQKISYASEDFTKEGYSSTIGNLFADLTLNCSREYAKKNNIEAPDFCLLNIGGIRTILPKGDVLVEQIYEIMPFENEMIFAQLNGKQMKDFFAYLLKEKKGHPLAGIKIEYDNNMLTSVTINGKAFDENKSYWVVTNDYLFIGGDDMKFFTNAKGVMTGEKLRDIFINEMKKYPTLPIAKDQRLIFNN